MIKEIVLENRKIEYTLTIKKVKNINLRIKPDGSVWVSANKWIKQTEIDKFLLSRSGMILGALDKFKDAKDREQIKYFDEKEIRVAILNLCQKVYPYYKDLGVIYPEIKFRKMKSRWGSCHPKNGLLTFNTNLMYAPIEVVEYVVHHEFTHFLVPNHSEKFYKELSKSCPDWKIQRNRLKEIILL